MVLNDEASTHEVAKGSKVCPSSTTPTLLARRVPVDAIEIDRAYVVYARCGGVGVAMRGEDGSLGYTMHREKFGNHYLFDELDWSNGEPFGSAIPLLAIDAAPPTEATALLAWLAERENEYHDTIQDAWRVILGPRYRLAPKGGNPEYKGLVCVNGQTSLVGATKFKRVRRAGRR